jgi:hypothetical protein
MNELFQIYIFSPWESSEICIWNESSILIMEGLYHPCSALKTGLLNEKFLKGSFRTGLWLAYCLENQYHEKTTLTPLSWISFALPWKYRTHIAAAAFNSQN